MASKGKDYLKQILLMKSQNDSTSEMSFIFLCFGKKSGFRLGIQSLHPLKGKVIRFYQTKRLSEPEALPRSEMLHFKPKDLSWAYLFWLVTINLSCLSVRSHYKTKWRPLQHGISEATGVLHVCLEDSLNFLPLWFPQNFKLLPLWSGNTRWFWKCWTRCIIISPAWYPKLCRLPPCQSYCLLAFFSSFGIMRIHPQSLVSQSFRFVSRSLLLGSLGPWW